MPDSLVLAILFGVLRSSRRRRRLPLERFASVHGPWGDCQQRGEDHTSSKNVHGLGELLNNITPSQADQTEQSYDEFVDLFGARLSCIVDVSR